MCGFSTRLNFLWLHVLTILSIVNKSHSGLYNDTDTGILLILNDKNISSVLCFQTTVRVHTVGIAYAYL